MNERSKILAMVGVGIGVASYFCKEGIEAIERTKSSLENELASYRTTLGQQTIQLQITESKQQLQRLMDENQKGRTSAKVNYSATILGDIVTTRQAQTMVQSDIEDVSILIEKLVLSGDLRKQLDKTKADVATNGAQVNDTLKPSPENGWERAAQVKLALVKTILSRLPVDVLGDTVITRAKHQVKVLDFLVSFGRWAVRFLFVVAACLTLYGVLTGVRVPESTE